MLIKKIETAGSALVCIMLLTFGPSVGGADPPVFDSLSILRFNTVCAHCHEGECSGRLSFSLGPEAAFSHIRRYAGGVDDTLGMKRDCAYAPMAAPDLHRPLQREILDVYRDPVIGNYFVPLGELEPGRYRLTMRLEVPATLRVEVLNDRFEFLVDECFSCNCALLPITMEIDETAQHFLRLRSPTALRLEELELSPETGGSRIVSFVVIHWSFHAALYA